MSSFLVLGAGVGASLLVARGALVAVQRFQVCPCCASTQSQVHRYSSSAPHSSHLYIYVSLQARARTASRAFYRGGFQSEMTRREAAQVGFGLGRPGSGSSTRARGLVGFV